jgi:phosphoribosyl-AMP cyclohydrolase / phosphoribosyl-ATP pyrophosphohydrolase
MSPVATDALLAATVFDAAGLVPVIAQDRATGGVRMFAWANREALQKTCDTGLGHFWSRSRQALWRKGEASGNGLRVRDIRLDCDGDVVLYLVDAEGPSCHTGHTSCFFRSFGATGHETQPGLVEDDGPPDPPAVIIARVARIIASRRSERPDNSYVVSLFDAGWPKILGKILEESGELVDALTEGDTEHTAHEAADLLFHVLVGLQAADVDIDAVFAQLKGRFGVSGIAEKASRPKVNDPKGTDPKADDSSANVTQSDARRSSPSKASPKT